MTPTTEPPRANKARLDNRWGCSVGHAFRSFTPSSRFGAHPRPSGASALTFAQPIEPLAMQYLVTKQLLALHDKYDGDLGLIDERWADKRDRELFSAEQIRTIGDYLQQLALSGVDCLAPDFRKEVERRINELELLIDPDVVSTLRERSTVQPEAIT